jgi:hypothetical protein
VLCLVTVNFKWRILRTISVFFYFTRYYATSFSWSISSQKFYNRPAMFSRFNTIFSLGYYGSCGCCGWYPVLSLIRDYSIFYLEVPQIYKFIWNFCADQFSFINHFFTFTHRPSQYFCLLFDIFASLQPIWTLLPLQHAEHHCLPLLSVTASSFPQYYRSFSQGLPRPFFYYLFPATFLLLPSYDFLNSNLSAVMKLATLTCSEFSTIRYGYNFEVLISISVLLSK